VDASTSSASRRPVRVRAIAARRIAGERSFPSSKANASGIAL
jgi:hypothetical protein